MKLCNSLSRSLETFTPLAPPRVGMYTCGPTVYDYATIGNFRTYVMADILARVLRERGFDVTSVMNFTDVGHLTGDNLGDASMGEDRMEAAARREAKTAWDIAKFYARAFLSDRKKLNILPPTNLVKATDHIPEQIALVRTLEAKGYTYRTSDGIYFDTSKFPSYGALSTLDVIKEGARVDVNAEKKHPRDFAVWKFSPAGAARQMEWNSPWGRGFPGWHLECSAMSMKYLGPSFDIHVGGEDLRSTHHPNEIAQSEAATGKPFVNYWVHVAFLLVDGQKMSKSLGNVFRLADVTRRRVSPFALRYLYCTTHYRKPLNFTWESLHAASQSLKRIKHFVLQQNAAGVAVPRPDVSVRNSHRDSFQAALDDDLDLPGSLAALAALVADAALPADEKLATIAVMDRVLGLDLLAAPRRKTATTDDAIRNLLIRRDAARAAHDWKEADRLRREIEGEGFVVEDTSEGTRVVPGTPG